MVGTVLGEIRLFAGTYEPRGWAYCDGRLLDVGSNFTLYELLGLAYGQNPAGTQFALPRLPSFVDSNGITIHYIINISGEWPQSMEGFLGSIKLFAGFNPPTGWSPCDGRVLSQANPTYEFGLLVQVLGSTYGGNGTTSVGLPVVPAHPAAIVVNRVSLPQYLISTQGPYAIPDRDNIAAGRIEEFIGEIGAFAGSYVPQGLLLANGQTISSTGAVPLASVLEQLGKQSIQLPNVPGLGNPVIPFLIARDGIYPARV